MRAATGGEVRFAGTAGTSGLTISIRTGDGYDTSYLHLSSLAVGEGAHVSAGERIGAVGTTGTRSVTAPHLHFGVRDEGTRHAYHDPLAFLPPAPMASPRPDPPAPAPAVDPKQAPPATAPAPPAGAPAPVGRRAPAARPVPVARPAPTPQGVPRPRSAPVAEPRPVSTYARQRSPAPISTRRPLSAADGMAMSHVAVDAEPGRVRSAQGSPVGTEESSARGEQAPTARAAHPRTETPPAAARPREHSPAEHLGASLGRHEAAHPGPDVAWAVACAGLLLAAGILGLSGDRPRVRSPIRGRLHPLVGRR